MYKLRSIKWDLQIIIIATYVIYNFLTVLLKATDVASDKMFKSKAYSRIELELLTFKLFKQYSYT